MDARTSHVDELMVFRKRVSLVRADDLSIRKSGWTYNLNCFRISHDGLLGFWLPNPDDARNLRRKANVARVSGPPSFCGSIGVRTPYSNFDEAVFLEFIEDGFVGGDLFEEPQFDDGPVPNVFL